METQTKTICLSKKEMKIVIKALESYQRTLEKKQAKLDAHEETVQSHDEMKALDDEWDRHDRRIYQIEKLLEAIESQMK